MNAAYPTSPAYPASTTCPVASSAAITIRLGGTVSDDVRVTELAGREGLNELFDYSVQLCSYGSELDLDTVLKSSCTIAIAAGSGTRFIHGIIRSFERLGEKQHYTYYNARVAPLHWTLTKRFGSRIFQSYNCPDMTVRGIISKVLLEGGIPQDMFRFVLPRELAEREYVVQYRESDYDFIARLMEDEGLTCYFEHSETRHTLVIGEAPTLFRINPIHANVSYCDPNGLANDAECVYGIRERRSVEFAAVGLTDYNFKRPGMDLRTRYPGGTLPPGRHSMRRPPPPYSGGPPYAPDESDYGGTGTEEHCGGGEPTDYSGGGSGAYDARTGYGEPSQPDGPAYNGSAGQQSGASYNGGSSSGSGGYSGSASTAGGYNGGAAPAGYNGNGQPAAGYGKAEGAPPPGSYEGAAPPTAPPYISHGGEADTAVPEGYSATPSQPGYRGNSGQDQYAVRSWHAPDSPRYPKSPAYKRYPPPAPREPYAPPSKPYTPPPPPPPPFNYGCTEVKVDYSAGYMEREEGQRRGQCRLEEHQCAARVYELSASVRGLMVGYQFALEYHPLDEFNAEYLVTEQVLAAKQSQSLQEDAGYAGGFRYDVQVRAIPAGVAYRPACRTPQPYVHGAQTALVVGPEDDEIYTDAYGRVKVQFHWDPDGRFNEFSSCWIRASQGMAGGNYGMMFLPRVGQEVIVDFLEGNPDRPIITGRVYNGDCMPPYKLPDYKTRSCIRTQSTPGGYGANEIRFEDKLYYEHLLVHAQRDLHLRSRANCFQTVGGNGHTLVYGNHYEKIAKKSNLEVCLDRNEKTGGNQSLTVCGDMAEGIHGKHSESCAAYTLKAEKGEVVIEAASGITLKVGGNFIKIDGAGVHVMGTLINLNSGGSPGIAYLRAPQPPYAPKPAYSAEYGYDVYYSTSGTPPESGYEGAQRPPDHEQHPDKPATWVEIELVDEAGQAWPNEAYEVIDPTGRVYRGRLDANGQAHVGVETDGECEICFPNLDQAAWERG